MQCLVVKPFPYSADGLKTTHRFVEGDEPDLPEAAVESLEIGGYVVIGLPPPSAEIVGGGVDAETGDGTQDESETIAEEMLPLVSPDEVSIPPDWRSMKWFALKALAEKIKGSDVAGSDEARAVIESKLSQRTMTES